MKRFSIFLLTLGLFYLGMSHSTHAQKFESEQISVELQGPSFSGQNTLGISGLRGRYFLSNSSAVRANLDITYNSNSTIIQQSQGSQKELKRTTNSFRIDLRPGYESHLSGTDRLSPYFGGELPIIYQSTSQKIERQVGNSVEETTIKNGQIGSRGPQRPGFLSLGLNGVAGADYYFANNLYLGVEVNFGLQYTINSSVKVEDTGSGNTPNDQTQANDFSLSTGTIGTFRLGYVFGGSNKE